MREHEQQYQSAGHPLSPPDLRALLQRDGAGYGVRELVELCGDLDALIALGDERLEATVHDEPPPPGRAGRLFGLVCDVAATRDEFEQAFQLPARLDDELVLAIGRFLRRADVSAAVARHRSNDQRLAAAVVWIVGRGNGEFSRRARRSASMLWDWFEVSDASTLARTLADELGLVTPEDQRWTEYPWTPIRLGDPALLTARTRQQLIEHRDVVIRLAQRDRQRREDGRALRQVNDSQIRISGRPASVSRVIKVSIDGCQRVAVMVGTDPSDPEEVLFLSVPDAHLLAQRLVAALDGQAVTGTTAA